MLGATFLSKPRSLQELLDFYLEYRLRRSIYYPHPQHTNSQASMMAQNNLKYHFDTTPYPAIPITPPSRIATAADAPIYRPLTKDFAVTTTHHRSPPSGDPDF